MKSTFLLACLAFVAVATGVSDPLDEGLALVERLMTETNQAISAHQASDPCAGLNANAASLTTAKNQKATDVTTATTTLTTINASIATKTARRTECGGLIQASTTEIQTQQTADATLKATLSNVSASWATRIAEAQQVIDQISAFQELIVGGKKLSLLQSSLLQLGEKVSFPIKSILDAQSRIATLVGKQTSGASLNPSMIEEADVTEKLKELFAALKTELDVHLTKLQNDKSAEESGLQAQINAKAAAIAAEQTNKENLEKEVNDLTTQLAGLESERTAASNAVSAAQTALTAAESDLATNAAAITSCEQKFASDLKALQDEHNSVVAIKTKLTAWKTGQPEALQAENVKKVTVAGGTTGVQVTCTTTIDNYLKYIKYNNQAITPTGNVNDWNNNKVFTFTTVAGGVLEIMGHDQEAGNSGHCRSAGFSIQCDATGDDFWNAFDSSSTNILAAGGKVATSDAEWNDWKAPCTTTSGFSLPANRNLKKLWAPDGERYGKFKMGPTVNA